MEFANKEYFILILLLIPYIVWYLLYRKKSVPSMRVSTTEAYRYGYSTWRTRLVHVPMVLHCICYTLLVCVLAQCVGHKVGRGHRHNAGYGRFYLNACRGPQA